VAHRILQLPTEIELERKPLVWSLGSAEYVGWADNYYGKPSAVVRVIQPAAYAGLLRRVEPENLPGELAAKVGETTFPFTRKIHRERLPIGPIEILICDLPPHTSKDFQEQPGQSVDGWRMRYEFLRLRRTTLALLEFLNRYGHWGLRALPRTISFQRGWDQGFVNFEKKWFKAKKPRSIPEVVFPNEIWFVDDEREPLTLEEPETESLKSIHVQDLMKWGLTCGAGEWFNSGYSHSKLDGPRAKFPHYVLAASSVYDVLIATITVDHLRETKFSVCARPDCRVPFPIESQHKRTYCSQYCAHLESVRRNRRRGKEGGASSGFLRSREIVRRRKS
jgi:hypothetical protein